LVLDPSMSLREWLGSRPTAWALNYLITQSKLVHIHYVLSAVGFSKGDDKTRVISQLNPGILRPAQLSVPLDETTMSQLIRRRQTAPMEATEPAESADLRLPERTSLVLMLLCSLLLQVRPLSTFYNCFMVHPRPGLVLHRCLLLECVCRTSWRHRDILRSGHWYPSCLRRPRSSAHDEIRSGWIHTSSPLDLWVSYIGSHHIRAGIPGQLSLSDSPRSHGQRTGIYGFHVHEEVRFYTSENLYMCD
jgi:hypothetical protein